MRGNLKSRDISLPFLKWTLAQSVPPPTTHENTYLENNVNIGGEGGKGGIWYHLLTLFRLGKSVKYLEGGVGTTPEVMRNGWR